MSSANDCIFFCTFFLGINYIAEKFDSFDGEEDPYTLAMITYALHKTSKDKIRSKLTGAEERFLLRGPE